MTNKINNLRSNHPDVEALIRDSVRRHQEFVKAMPDHKCNPQERFVCSELLLATRLEAAIRGLRKLGSGAVQDGGTTFSMIGMIAVDTRRVCEEFNFRADLARKTLREIGVKDE